MVDFDKEERAVEIEFKNRAIKCLANCLHEFETSDGLYVSDKEDFSEQFVLDNSKLEEEIKDILRMFYPKRSLE